MRGSVPETEAEERFDLPPEKKARVPELKNRLYSSLHQALDAQRRAAGEADDGKRAALLRSAEGGFHDVVDAFEQVNRNYGDRANLVRRARLSGIRALTGLGRHEDAERLMLTFLDSTDDAGDRVKAVRAYVPDMPHSDVLKLQRAEMHRASGNYHAAASSYRQLASGTLRDDLMVFALTSSADCWHRQARAEGHENLTAPEATGSLRRGQDISRQVDEDFTDFEYPGLVNRARLTRIRVSNLLGDVNESRQALFKILHSHESTLDERLAAVSSYFKGSGISGLEAGERSMAASDYQAAQQSFENVLGGAATGDLRAYALVRSGDAHMGQAFAHLEAGGLGGVESEEYERAAQAYARACSECRGSSITHTALLSRGVALGKLGDYSGRWDAYSTAYMNASSPSDRLEALEHILPDSDSREFFLSNAMAAESVVHESSGEEPYMQARALESAAERYGRMKASVFTPEERAMAGFLASKTSLSAAVLSYAEAGDLESMRLWEQHGAIEDAERNCSAARRGFVELESTASDGFLKNEARLGRMQASLMTPGLRQDAIGAFTSLMASGDPTYSQQMRAQKILLDSLRTDDVSRTLLLDAGEVLASGVTAGDPQRMVRAKELFDSVHSIGGFQDSEDVRGYISFMSSLCDLRAANAYELQGRGLDASEHYGLARSGLESASDDLAWGNAARSTSIQAHRGISRVGSATALAADSRGLVSAGVTSATWASNLDAGTTGSTPGLAVGSDEADERSLRAFMSAMGNASNYDERMTAAESLLPDQQGKWEFMQAVSGAERAVESHRYDEAASVYRALLEDPSVSGEQRLVALYLGGIASLESARPRMAAVARDANALADSYARSAVDSYVPGAPFSLQQFPLEPLKESMDRNMEWSRHSCQDAHEMLTRLKQEHPVFSEDATVQLADAHALLGLGDSAAAAGLFQESAELPSLSEGHQRMAAQGLNASGVVGYQVTAVLDAGHMLGLGEYDGAARTFAQVSDNAQTEGQKVTASYYRAEALLLSARDLASQGKDEEANRRFIEAAGAFQSLTGKQGWGGRALIGLGYSQRGLGDEAAAAQTFRSIPEDAHEDIVAASVFALDGGDIYTDPRHSALREPARLSELASVFNDHRLYDLAGECYTSAAESARLPQDRDEAYALAARAYEASYIRVSKLAGGVGSPVLAAHLNIEAANRRWSAADSYREIASSGSYGGEARDGLTRLGVLGSDRVAEKKGDVDVARTAWSERLFQGVSLFRGVVDRLRRVGRRMGGQVV
ncbi:MAG: hypothetical protein GF416_02490 [Candidatus Altiarchaeales archaeon]|nr:hypothetical protein [Candidatus Altiarchaeales archaeon]